MQIYWTKINQIIDESSEIKTYMLDCPEGFTWEEGSYIHFAMEGFNAGEKPNKSLVRHMSICTLPKEKSIGITTRIKEHCSEFKSVLRDLEVGANVALFKTRLNIPLRRENKNIYLLSSGVGLATFRPVALEYLENPENISSVYSLNIDSSKEYLFTDIFESAADKNFTSEYVDNRNNYYEKVESLASHDKDGIYYVVGSDEFLLQNIEVLQDHGIKQEQIMLDKNERQLPNFLPVEAN